jgi:hypothetical protein
MTKPAERQQKENRLKRAKALEHIDPCSWRAEPPAGAVLADPSQLVHNRTYGPLPRFYGDKVVACRNCGKEEVWPAERQKWWYEVAKGNINTKAVLCRACRNVRKERNADARQVHLEGLAKKKVANLMRSPGGRSKV